MAVVKYRMSDGSYAPISFPGAKEINQQLIRKYSLENNILSLMNTDNEVLLSIDLSSLEQEIPEVSSSVDGLMLAKDKVKLDGIANNAEVNQNAFTNITVDSTIIAADSKTDTLAIVAGPNVILTPDATNDKITIAATNTTYDIASISSNGLMSANDKSKLDSYSEEAWTFTLENDSTITKMVVLK